MTPDITLLMPAYKGSDFIAESIRSVLDQTYGGWRLHISVDAADAATADVALSFDDPRIEVVVQDRRLGWPGNFNWLMDQVETPYACYWQQDDFASTTYLEALRAELVAFPNASIAYTDVQWFGSGFERTSLPSTTGSDLARTMAFIEDIRYEPLRGLIRMAHMPSWPDAIPVADSTSTQEEFVLLTALAAAGEFRRAESAMYFKRRHDNNTYRKWLEADRYRVRNAWISMGVGMAKIALDLAEPHQHRAVILAVLDRLTIERPGRAFWSQTAQTTSELSRFAHDFILTLGRDVGTAHALANEDLFRRVDERIAAAVEKDSRLGVARVEISNEVEAEGVCAVSPLRDPHRFYSVLGTGWSGLEDWGVWSDGPQAQILLPDNAGGISTVEIDAVYFGQAGPSVIEISVYGAEVASDNLEESGTRIVVDVPQGGSIVTISPQNPQSPKDLGMSTDERQLGVGLQTVTFRA